MDWGGTQNCANAFNFGQPEKRRDAADRFNARQVRLAHQQRQAAAHKAWETRRQGIPLKPKANDRRKPEGRRGR